MKTHAQIADLSAIKQQAKFPLYLLFLEGIPVFQQLQLEEALLRADQRNWCLINRGSIPTIVMGISGNAAQLIDFDQMQKRPVPLVRRFSGGGTVFVDRDTIFMTWICNVDQSEIACSPEKVHHWAENQLRAAYPSLPIHLIENDYAIGQRKCGGNAQYLSKKRWLHHSSFLWDYDPLNMRYLKMPPKTPLYRQQRTHEDFLCCLKEYFFDQEQFYHQLLESLQTRFFVTNVLFHEAWETTERPHRKATVQID